VAIDDGAVRVDQQLEPETSLQALYVLRGLDQYIVTASVPYSTNSTSTRYYTVLSVDLCPFVTGRVYAFQRATGKPQWSAPATVAQYGLPLDQPADSPVLVFLRHITTRQSRTSPQPSTRASVMILDRRTGRLIHRDDELVNNISGYEFISEPETRTVNIQLTANQLKLEFTDEPIPPEPPAQADMKAARTESSAVEQLGKFADAVLQGLVKKPAEKPDQKPQQAEAAPVK
jgi:hypothetical protein